MKLPVNSRFNFFFRRWRICLCAIATVLLIGLSPVQAQEEVTPSNQIDGYPVMLDGQELFRIKQGIPGAATAEERAEIIHGRLVTAANDPAISPDSIRVEDEGEASIIKVGDTTLMTVRKTDLEVGQSHQAVADGVVKILRPSVTEYR